MASNENDSERHYFYQPTRESTAALTGATAAKTTVVETTVTSATATETETETKEVAKDVVEITAVSTEMDMKKVKKKAASKGDPLDAIMAILAVLILITVGSWFVGGFGIYVTIAVLLLLVIAYLRAPRRTFPTAAKIAEGANLKGKIVLVTGATSGIGVETARVLALKGARVYIAARNPTKLQTTRDESLKTLPQGTEIELLECDLADLNSVKACAENFLAKETNLHILINNAGIMAVPERTPTKQDLESQVGVCHVGHFYLTKLLLPALEKAATKEVPARVVALSSSAHTYHNMTQLLQSSQLETLPYDPTVAYGNAKCCNSLFSHELHKRFYVDKHIAAFSVMPGGIFTGLQGHVHPWKMFKWMVVGPFFFKSLAQGAATTLQCALTADPDADGGEYFDNCQATDCVATVLEDVGSDAGVRLWTSTEKLLTDLGV